ncbi:MAG: DUF4304 domain-containing protein [Bacteroidetes bacterium]|nr:DUF4304 domain-containing protein [Bacteroidota bacterium]
MGLFAFLKPKNIDRQAVDKIARLDPKSSLDEIEKVVYEFLKPLGFMKKGRTFNRVIEKGLVQVINFQSGQYPVGNYEIPGLKDNLYGKFTVNLGVCIENLYRFQWPDKKNTFYKEYDCQIRERLEPLMHGVDQWWPLTKDLDKTANEIIQGLSTVGFQWFDGINTIDKIIEKNGTGIYDTSPRAKLDVALVVWFADKQKGTKLFKQYLDNIADDKTKHREYVEQLGRDNGIIN